MNRRRGFTLIEVLVAMTILSMAFAVVFSISSRALDGMGRAEEVERRVEFARNMIERLKLISDLEVDDSAAGTLEDGTRWAVAVTPFIEPVREGALQNPDAVVHVRLALDWQGRREPQSWAIGAYRLIHPRPSGSSHTPLETQLRALLPN